MSERDEFSLEAVYGKYLARLEEHVRGVCPSCKSASLFLGRGGAVTCSNLSCADPLAADGLFHAALARTEKQGGDSRE